MYKITLIGEDSLNTVYTEQDKAQDFFASMGIDFYEAKQNKVPAFVVTELNNKPGGINNLK